ncbi:amidase [Martelella soudanensis]|uniref:amidase n=1 Tax=unclassified Martelella TaxID=2629616 RepID=UPI0015DD8781|nr:MULTISPECIES: amidase [unclassified Martelella]
MTVLHYQGLVEIGELIASRQVSAVEVTRHQLERCQNLASLNAFITLLAERALAQAVAADRDIAAGLRRSVLHGVPVALKDLYDLTGTPTTAGMPVRHEAIAAANATVTQRLLDAGAVILGKTCMTEGAYAEHRAPFGTPVNPWNPDRWCGASSSGSAVGVAAGLFFAGLATETGGSIRIPSAMNGVTGFKPSWGRVSRAGVYQLAASLDHAGPIARSVTDAAAVLSIIAGRDSADPTSSHRPVENYLSEAGVSLKGIRIGIDMAFSHAGTDPEHVSAMLAAADTLRDLGADLIDVTLPNSEQIIWDWFDVCAVQNALVNGPVIDKQPGALGPALTELVARGRALKGADYQVVINRANAFRGDLEALFASLDLVLSPAMAFSPPLNEAMEALSDDMISGIHRFTCPFTMSGHPVLSMPGGVHSDGMPINIQLIGPLFGEAALARAGMAFQKATQWHRRRPLS